MKAVERLQREDGFTLAELLIVFVVLSLIVYAAFTMLDSNIKAGAVYKMQADLSQEMKQATDQMADQIRTARTFLTAADSDLRFTSYVTGTDTLYNVRFWLASGEIHYAVDEGGVFLIPDTVIARNVGALNFNYIGSSGGMLAKPVASLSSIYGVQVSVTISKTSFGVTENAGTTTVVRVKR